MNLGSATALLGDSGRHFMDVYKLYNYRDDMALKTYLDFVVHEPAEWMRGFPQKLRTRTTFALPKTAMIKLLKLPAITDAFGTEYVKQVYDAVWNTYKKHGDAILEERLRSASAATIAAHNRQKSPSIEDYMDSENISETESVHSELPVPVPPAARTDARVIHFTTPTSSSAVAAAAPQQTTGLLAGALRDLLKDVAQTQPGLAASYMRLLDHILAV
jgi:hypothetical protein